MTVFLWPGALVYYHTLLVLVLFLSCSESFQVYTVKTSSSISSKETSTRLFSVYKPPDFTVIGSSASTNEEEEEHDNGDDDTNTNEPSIVNQLESIPADEQPSHTTRVHSLRNTPKRQPIRQQPQQRQQQHQQQKPVPDGNWMERNSQFHSKTFQQDFRGTRVFVQNIPPQATWQLLKDHFRLAGTVVFASISKNDPTTGIVQYETTDMAQHAIKVMRDHPLLGSNLFVRKDVQQNNANEKNLLPKWKCANPEQVVSSEHAADIQDLLQARDRARRHREYNVADTIRQDLYNRHSVQIDDRLQLWWWSFEQAPDNANTKTDRSVNSQPAWEQIPTDHDHSIDSHVVLDLLQQRDTARRQRDYVTADRLLDQLCSLPPDDGMTLRIHDASRTWRLWSERRPRKSATDSALEIVRQYAPSKLDEMKSFLNKFPGREYQILKRLKQQYLGEESQNDD